MNKMKEAQAILKEMGMPKEQLNEMSALTLLALCDIKEKSKWRDARRSGLKVTKGIMAFMAEQYGRRYAPNTRETVRRHVLHQFVQAGIADYNPDNPKLPVNSPNAHYAISEIALETIRNFGTRRWNASVAKFKKEVGELTKKYQGVRNLKKIPLKLLNGKTIHLSPGKHNQLQAAIVNQFASRFAMGATLLYLGDTAKKNLYVESEALKKLGITFDEHSKLPDIIIYDPKREWLYLIEAVTSHGPITPKRILELEDLLKDCGAGKIYVSAFPDSNELKKHLAQLAWETEVWLMEHPDHMIHFNGDRFIGPRK